MFADKYDLNVWSDGKKLYLSAYELMLCDDGLVRMNSSKFRTIGWEFDNANDNEITWLLDNPFWENEDWTDHDDWVSLDSVMHKAMPSSIRAWLEALPDYEMENGN